MKQKENRIKKFIRAYGMDYLFAAPFLIVFFVFTVFPIVASVALSLTDFNAVEIRQFVGLKNYFNLLLDDALFLQALRNTFFVSVITGPIGFFLSLIVAWLLNEMSTAVRSVVSLLFYAPAISGGAFAIWTTIYSGDAYGFLNGFLMNTGFINEPIQWLTDSDYMLPAAIAVILWMSFGTGFLSLIAGFKNVDKTLYEAAAVDGVKNRFQELWYITLPSMKPQLTFSAVMSITGSFGVGDVITGIFGFPTSGYALHTLVHHMQDYGNTRFEMGYASAIAVVLFLIMITANGIVQRLIRKVGE